MEKNQNLTVSKSQKNLFSLKAIHKQRRPHLNATFLMSKGPQSKSKKVKARCSTYQGPILNLDRCHATPAFILPQQKIEYEQTVREILCEHDKRVNQAEQQINQVLVPKPRSKNLYCSVCHQNYIQYLDHIKSISHKVNIRKSSFNNSILQLALQFNSHNSKDIATNSETRTDDEADVAGARGRKVIKVNQAGGYTPTYYPFMGLNFQHQSLRSSNPNSFGSQLAYNQNCRNFCYPGYNGFPMQPFYSCPSPYMSYPIFNMPYQPTIAIDIFHQ